MILKARIYPNGIYLEQEFENVSRGIMQDTKITFIVNTSKDVFANWLQAHSRHIAYTHTFPTDKGRIILSPFRQVYSHSSSPHTAKLEMEGSYITPQKDTEIVTPLPSIIEYELTA